jgi:hypothetical protein
MRKIEIAKNTKAKQTNSNVNAAQPVDIESIKRETTQYVKIPSFNFFKDKRYRPINFCSKNWRRLKPNSMNALRCHLDAMGK